MKSVVFSMKFVIFRMKIVFLSTKNRTCKVLVGSSISSNGLAPGLPSMDSIRGRTRTQTRTRVLSAAL